MSDEEHIRIKVMMTLLQKSALKMLKDLEKKMMKALKLKNDSMFF